MNIYVGNLNYKTTEEEFTNLFKTFGTVKKVKLVKDFETGRAKGFGFVEMSDVDGKQAVATLHGTEFLGRELVVNEAREREQKPRYNTNKY